MHQNLEIFLQQFNYSKNSFIVLVPVAYSIQLFLRNLLNFSHLCGILQSKLAVNTNPKFMDPQMD